MKRTLSRKTFLNLAVAGGGASLLAGCDFLSTHPDQGGGRRGGAPEANGAEAPMLAEQVKQGLLPPVEQRLPDNPRVIEPVERIGRYGGTWRTPLASTVPAWVRATVLHDHLVAWDPTWSELIPNVAESFEVIDDGREYIFTLRRGMKWSDGEPFTAADLGFWYEAVFNNRELTPVPDSQLSASNGEPLVLNEVDDYTVKFTFAEPNGLFLPHLARNSAPLGWFPRHYLERFHPDYNDDVDSLVDEANMPDWVELFSQKASDLNNPELPVLAGWLPTNPFSDGIRQEWVRNPYYFKVDSDGSQLPYIDKVVFTFFQDPEPLLLSVAAGEVDLYFRDQITVASNRPVLARDQEVGGYSLFDLESDGHNTVGIELNLNHEDAMVREMFQKKDFRIGLSYAINRQEIIDIVYQRQGEPSQTAPRPEAPFYDSDMAKQFTEFDLDLANDYLDRAGYTDRDGEGRRLGTNRQPISISVLVQTRHPAMVDAMELVQATWATVGVELKIESVSLELALTRIAANQHDCIVDSGEAGHIGMVLDPRWLFATAQSFYAPLWANWYLGDAPQAEPPEAMRRQIEIYRKEVLGQADLEAQFEGMREIVEIAREEFWTMGISLPAGGFGIVSNRFHNVTEHMWLAIIHCPYPAVTNVSQYFIEEA